MFSISGKKSDCPFRTILKNEGSPAGRPLWVWIVVVWKWEKCPGFPGGGIMKSKKVLYFFIHTILIILLTSCSKNFLKVEHISSIEYTTETNQTIKAEYYRLEDNSLNFVKLLLPNENTIITLPNSVSASGSRYTDGRDYIWWVKGSKALLEKRDENGNFRVKYSDCIESSKLKWEKGLIKKYITTP